MDTSPNCESMRQFGKTKTLDVPGKHIFYTPDGHRRYADRVGCDLVKAYQIGYEVLLDEIVRPVLARNDVATVSIFLLSQLNIQRRADGDLKALLEEGEKLLSALTDAVLPMASVRTFGAYMKQNILLRSDSPKQLNLFIGSRVDDRPECGEVDVFFRSGGELRLSGAPRSLLGNYTQLYAIDTLHPDLRYGEVDSLLARHGSRYMREFERRADADGV
jgi:undecaprenyl pyrophosphate synthase